MPADAALDALTLAATRLEEEINHIPQVQMLAELRSLIAKRRLFLGVPGPETEHIRRPSIERKPPLVGDRTIAAVVQDAAANFLRTMGRRAQTPEIAREIMRLGIQAGKPENIIATVSSYLSTAKDRFDNVRGAGYGLVEWAVNDAPSSSDQTAPSNSEPALPPGRPSFPLPHDSRGVSLFAEKQVTETAGAIEFNKLHSDDDAS